MMKKLEPDMSGEWGFVCENSDIARIVASANGQTGGISAEMHLRDGRRIDAHYRFMEDLAELANDHRFTGQIAFAPGYEGLQPVLEIFQRSLRDDTLQ